MPRRTPAQLRAEIIDRASAIFARQGLRNTSLQQIADAIAYSKAGLLHYFPSKEAIYRAAITTTSDKVAVIANSAMAHPPGAARDRALVTATVDLTFEWPGVALLMISLSEQDDPEEPELTEASTLLAAAMGLGADASDERTIRVLMMATGVTETARTAVRLDLKREWRTPIIQAALSTLGHRRQSL